MSRESYPFTTHVMPVGHVGHHSTSSAFSSSANADEDWTQISDLAERRRIQNRIAQRNYRKKLKRRLEDLEQRAGPSESPPDVNAKLQSPAKKATPKVPAVQQRKQPPDMPSYSPYTPSMSSDDNLFSSDFDQEGSQSPPIFAYQSTYPPPEENAYPSYPSTSSYRTSAGTVSSPEAYPTYMAPGPMALPSMMYFNESRKRDSLPSMEDGMDPFGMGYGGGHDYQTPHYYGDSNLHTPPLSHSFNKSISYSDACLPVLPTTPMSMPPSPRRAS